MFTAVDTNLSNQRVRMKNEENEIKNSKIHELKFI